MSLYIRLKKVPAPKPEVIGGLNIRSWSDADIDRVRKILPKVANGRKTRWQKERAKKARKKK